MLYISYFIYGHLFLKIDGVMNDGYLAGLLMDEWK